MSQPTAPILRTHPLTGAPIVPVGHVRGRAVWPIMGGAPDDPPAGGAPTPPAGDTPPAGGDGGAEPPAGGQVDLSKLSVDQLKAHPEFQAELNRVVGERVKKEQEKAQARIEEEKRRLTLDEAGKQAAALADEQAKVAAATEATTKAYELVARTKAEVLAIAEGGRADRSAAIVAQADLTGAVDSDGNVSDAVVRAAVQKVLEAYPEWKAAAGDGAPATPGKAGGELNPPGGGAGPKFTQTQIEAMSTEERVERWPEIEKAIAEGRIIYGK